MKIEDIEVCPECGGELEGNNWVIGCPNCGLVIKKNPVTGKLRSFWEEEE